jgi:hypothetical protein
MLPRLFRNFTSSVNRANKIISVSSSCSIKSNYSQDSTGEGSTTVKEETRKLGGFAQAFEKHTNLDNQIDETPKETFAQLLRNSKFIDVIILA